jgi:hypothetical protein
MAYYVEIDEALVLDYLRHPDRCLANSDVVKLLGFLEGLAHAGDEYRNDLSRRCSPGSPHFEVTYLFADTTAKVRVFRFIISDAAAAYGVLRVRFAEEL